jgi:hypothetical protein
MYLLSDQLVLPANLPIPANVLGVIILFGLLCLGVIKVEQVEGTALSLMENQRQGAMSGLAMILAGIFTAWLAPLVYRLLG